ncbi:MAG: hypothetical protein JXB49_11080 [Bacteroidales bacterium]|nr:hypothetical protein [Bacteroidales bacterium]
MTFLRTIKKALLNLPGWRTNRKIVVFESDDWGSIRMPSKSTYIKCLNAGYPVDKIAYERYDSLMSSDDLELLFDLLHSHRDKNGYYPVITANCVVANPDFQKIKQDQFQNYHFELITETFKKYPKHSSNFKLWQEGIRSKVFFPQYHAREHLNVSLFMNSLRKADPDILFGFENQMPGNILMKTPEEGNVFVEATRFHSLNDKKGKLSIYLEGLDIFEKLFNYRSESVIPPNYSWCSDYNEAVYKKGVRYFQGVHKMIEPVVGGKDKRHTYYLGMKNYLGQLYLIRNIFFEPSLVESSISDPVRKCLADIDIAFRMHKPAVICSHRINYVGYIVESNRDRTLNMLDKLLKMALKRWPDIEFMTSVQLGHLIT